MKRLKLMLAILSVFILSFLINTKFNGIYGYIKATSTLTNEFTIQDMVSYTVRYETMDLNGSTYSFHSEAQPQSVWKGTSVTPEVIPITGFNSPAQQTVAINSDNTVITYQYTRKQFTLTITDSNFVTTSTPTGTYYYGTPITLVADATDNNGNTFVKWTDNTTNRNYTFTLEDDTTIGPIYSQRYNITYVYNNGEANTTGTVIQNQAIGTLPSPTYDDCVGSTGDYETRQCTEVYKFEGWYTESTFVNKVYENYVPTADTTLYAKWNKIYYAKDSITCDGSTIEYTGVKMFDELNADKDFIVKFTVNTNNGWVNGSGGDNRGTIFTDMNETGDPWPGIHFYTDKNPYKYTMNANKPGSKFKDTDTGYILGQEVTIKKAQGILYYKYGNGSFIQINDFNNFTAYYDGDASFCAGVNINNNKTPYRFFVGTITNMSIELQVYPTYTIHYEANGGTGIMDDQSIKIGSQTQLTPNEFTRNDASFKEWNTVPDGSGQSYPNNYTITSDLGNDGDTITLYAQWILPEHFYVHFDANGGTGTMADQEFTINAPLSPLTTNAFTRTNYEFRGWNTATDGSGTHYDDEQAVRDLSNTDNDVITLYAQWMKIVYSNLGDVVFNGTANTFIDTGVNVFSNDTANNDVNINKDFEIRFTFVSVDADQLTITPQQPTIFNVKDESNAYMPGFNIRFNATNNINNMSLTKKWAGNTGSSQTIVNVSKNNAPIDFIYKRVNGVITAQYKYGNTTSQVYTLIDQVNGWQLNQPFATNVAFGGYFDSSNQPGRFFKGTLRDIMILMDE